MNGTGLSLPKRSQRGRQNKGTLEVKPQARVGKYPSAAIAVASGLFGLAWSRSALGSMGVCWGNPVDRNQRRPQNFIALFKSNPD